MGIFSWNHIIFLCQYLWPSNPHRAYSWVVFVGAQPEESLIEIYLKNDRFDMSPTNDSKLLVGPKMDLRTTGTSLEIQVSNYCYNKQPIVVHKQSWKN